MSKKKIIRRPQIGEIYKCAWPSGISDIPNRGWSDEGDVYTVTKTWTPKDLACYHETVQMRLDNAKRHKKGIGCYGWYTLDRWQELNLVKIGIATPKELFGLMINNKIWNERQQKIT